jgi:hypothetical protein
LLEPEPERVCSRREPVVALDVGVVGGRVELAHRSEVDFAPEGDDRLRCQGREARVQRVSTERRGKDEVVDGLAGSATVTRHLRCLRRHERATDGRRTCLYHRKGLLLSACSCEPIPDLARADGDAATAFATSQAVGNVEALAVLAPWRSTMRSATTTGV